MSEMSRPHLLWSCALKLSDDSAGVTSQSQSIVETDKILHPLQTFIGCCKTAPVVSAGVCLTDLEPNTCSVEVVLSASEMQQRAHLHDVEVALVGLPKGVAAAGEAVEEDEAEGEDVDALALAHLLPAAAEQLLRGLPPAASPCTASLANSSYITLPVCQVWPGWRPAIWGSHPFCSAVSCKGFGQNHEGHLY